MNKQLPPPLQPLPPPPLLFNAESRAQPDFK